MGGVVVGCAASGFLHSRMAAIGHLQTLEMLLGALFLKIDFSMSVPSMPHIMAVCRASLHDIWKPATTGNRRSVSNSSTLESPAVRGCVRDWPSCQKTLSIAAWCFLPSRMCGRYASRPG